MKEINEMNEKWSNLEEISEYLGVTKDTIRNWIKKPISLLIKLVDSGSLNFQKLMNGSRVEKVR